MASHLSKLERERKRKATPRAKVKLATQDMTQEYSDVNIPIISSPAKVSSPISSPLPVPPISAHGELEGYTVPTVECPPVFPA